MRLKIAILFGLIFITTLCYARESFNEHLFKEPPKITPEGPWFTGPILTPSSHVVPCGHQNYEPYVYWTQDQGTYDSNWKFHSKPTFNNVLFQGSLQFGIFPSTEFDIAPQLTYNQTRGQHMWRVSDLPFTLAFQLLNEKEGEWYPVIKLRFAANAPFGKYDQLSPARLGTDVGGIGTWYPSVGLVFGKLFHINGVHYLSSRLFLTYNFGTPTNVRGLSVYGGAPSSPGVQETRGRVYPGNVFLFLNGYEFSLTQNWALALDIQYQHTNGGGFSGFSARGTRPVLPSQELFALAPGLEYNWNANMGIIVGPWFSIAGRNTSKFVSYVAALNIYV